MDNNKTTDRLCWFCKHFKCDDLGSPNNYSEYTPGWAGLIDCTRKHYKDSSDIDDVKLARLCEDFEWSPAIIEELGNPEE